jgi:hypothetical protein
VLFPGKRDCRGAQAPPLLVCWWVVVALRRDPGQGTLTGRGTSLPATRTYWTTRRLVRSGPWDAPGLMTALAATTLRTLPPPLDGVRYLSGERPLTAPRGQQHPRGHTTRHREPDPDPWGGERVRLLASWDRCRLPLALVPIDPPGRGPQHSLCRQLVKAVVPPAWARRVVGGADAGCAANATRRRSAAPPDADGLARPRTRPLTPGKPRRDMVHPLPQRCSSRRARDTPDGPRQDAGVCARRATLHHLGEVALVRSKTRRHEGPKGVKSLVPHLSEANAGEGLSL